MGQVKKEYEELTPEDLLAKSANERQAPRFSKAPSQASEVNTC